jgi:hypothetical protein
MSSACSGFSPVPALIAPSGELLPPLDEKRFGANAMFSP